MLAFAIRRCSKPRRHAGRGAARVLLFRFVGDPVNQMVGQDTTLEDRLQLRKDLGLDDPIPVQFARFVWSAVQFDFGISYQVKQPVTAHHRRALSGHPGAGVRGRRCSPSRSAFRWASIPASTATAGCPRCS